MRDFVAGDASPTLLPATKVAAAATEASRRNYGPSAQDQGVFDQPRRRLISSSSHDEQQKFSWGG